MIRIFNQYVSPKSVLLMFIEGGLIALALLCGVRLRFWNSPDEMEALLHFPEIAEQVLVVIITFQLCFYYSDLYNLNVLRGRTEQLICLGQSLGSACLVLGALYYIDKATILKKGNAQPSVAVFARFAPYGREEAQWFVKQALDIGLMGVIFNGIDNREQALLAVRNMRYPQKKTSKYPEPTGLRGYAPGNAVWWWGIPDAEYERRADLWPLNPDGDLLAIMMIETSDGLKNADAIAAVPGVGAIFVGAGADLSQYLGVERNAPELEQGLQTILRACLAHNVPCGITALSGGEIARRLAEGWKMIRSTEAAIGQWRASLAGR